jgi:O-antigen ligase
MASLVRYLPYPLEWAWILLCIATLTFTSRPAAGALSGTIDNTIYLRFSFVLCALAIVAFHFKRVPKLRLNPISLFFAYVFFGVTSSLWSASFVASLGKSVELLAATLVVWVTMARPDRELRLRRLVYLTIAEAVLELAYASIGAIFDPSDFSEPSRGIFPHALAAPRVSSNSISQFGAFVGLFFLAKALTERRWLYGVCYLICAVFPVAAQGRTGMVSFVVGSALLFARCYPIGSFFGIPAVVGVAGVLLGNDLLKLFLRGQDEELLYSLSGRTTLWEASWEAFFKKPFFGSGFGVGGRELMLNLVGYRSDLISSVHNGFLELLLGVGFLGFLPWAGSVIWTLHLAAAAYFRGDSLPLVIGMIVAFTATCLSIGLGGWLDIVPQYFLAVSGFLWVRSRQRVEAGKRYGGPGIRPAIAG